MGPGTTVRVGTCGFPIRRERILRELDAVEIQSTFYRVPRVESAETLREQAPDRFVFCVKAWQGITHPPTSPTYRRARLSVPEELRDRYGGFRTSEEVMEGYARLIEYARALDAAVLLFQTPRSFGPSEEHEERAVGFLHMASREMRVAWEPRGWPEEAVRRVIRRVWVVHVVDPFADRPVTRKEVYFRLHGSPPGDRRYYHNYSRRDLAALRRFVGDRHGHVFFNNITMFDDAVSFREMLSGDSGERGGPHLST